MFYIYIYIDIDMFIYIYVNLLVRLLGGLLASGIHITQRQNPSFYVAVPAAAQAPMMLAACWPGGGRVVLKTEIGKTRGFNTKML